MRERQPQTFPLENATMKVLVILWDDRRHQYKLIYIFNDQFITVAKKKKEFPQRLLVYLISYRFIIAPIVIRTNIFMQEFWKSGVTYDEKHGQKALRSSIIS